MDKVKYVRTCDDQIIVFSEVIEHATFKNLNPVTAGFIQFYKKGEFKDIACNCYGESYSLGLKSDPSDTILAQKQILLED